MGFDKNKRPAHQPFEATTFTFGSTASTMAEEAVNFVTVDSSGVANDGIIPDPTFKGASLEVLLDNQTTSEEASFHISSTGNSFFGLSGNTISIDTTVGPNYFELKALSTSEWGIVNLSGPEPATSTAPSDIGQKHWSVTQTTGSTAQ